MSPRPLSWPSRSCPPAAGNIFSSQDCLEGLPSKKQNQRAGRGAKIRGEPCSEEPAEAGKGRDPQRVRDPPPAQNAGLQILPGDAAGGGEAALPHPSFGLSTPHPYPHLRVPSPLPLQMPKYDRQLPGIPVIPVVSLGLSVSR